MNEDLGRYDRTTTAWTLNRQNIYRDKASSSSRGLTQSSEAAVLYIGTESNKDGQESIPGTKYRGKGDVLVLGGHLEDYILVQRQF